MAAQRIARCVLLCVFFVVVSASTEECVRKDKLIDCWNFCTPRDAIIKIVDLLDIPTCMNKCFQTTIDYTPVTPRDYQFQFPKKSTSPTDMLVPTIFAIFLVAVAVSCPKLFV
jgi:hypothetical protein